MNGEAPSNPAGTKVVRRGRASWLTHPPAGVAHIGVESHAFGAVPVSLPEGDPVPGEATPGELLAVTHAVSLAWALSEALALAGSPADEIVVEASCTFTGPVPDRELTALDLSVHGRVPGLDATGFGEAVAEARPRSLRATGAREGIPGRLEAVLASSAPRADTERR
jgi:organic hydroperoxide reductase OsmC/OhrA